MALRIVAGTANRALADAIAATLYTEAASPMVERFPDGEVRPSVSRVRGADVYLVHPTGPPVNDHVVELLLLLDACRRARAARITAVVPYFGYARQDRRAEAGDAIGVRVMADALAHAGAQRLVVVDPHTVALEAMCAIPVEMLTAVPALTRVLEKEAPAEAVVVAPDLGAAKLAQHYAAVLSRPVAVVLKTRVSGTSVMAEDLIGDVAGRPAVIVDDMISTGATIEAAVEVLLSHGAVQEIVVAATHGLLVGTAKERLSRSPIRNIVVTDTLPQSDGQDLPIQVCSVAPLLGDAIGRLHLNEPLDHVMLRA